MSAALATPSSTIRIASSPSATPSRDVAKPGESATRIACLPSAAAKASAAATVAADVSGPCTISTSGIAATGLKKWIPTTRSGRRVARAIAAIESDDVLEPRIRASPQARSSARKTSILRARDSGTASMAIVRRAASWSIRVDRRSRSRRRRGLRGVELARLDGPLPRGLDRRDDPLSRRGVRLDDGGGEPGKRADARDPASHRPAADDED